MLRTSVVLRPLLALGAVLFVAACTGAPPPPSPPELVRCQRDYALWRRYIYGHDLNHTGQRMRAELALHHCDKGKYHPAIEVIEDMLRRGKVPIPPPPAAPPRQA